MKPEVLRRLDEVVWVDPDRLSGAPCFRGTRIPVQMLIDHLAAGFALDEFLETVPSLDRTGSDASRGEIGTGYWPQMNADERG
jgi:uncharacterized protein (DUF433 family)